LSDQKSKIYLVLRDTALKAHMNATKPPAEITAFTSVNTIGYTETLNYLSTNLRRIYETFNSARNT
jgi:hypothetical protein